MTFEPTPQQHAAITTTGKHLCVDAGAGSGKTSVLVQRILHLLDQGVPLRHIVAITFTRKAATEMRERLRRAIHNAPDRDDPASMTKWRELEYQVESARITTIDAFCAGLLRENALRIGLDPDFVLMANAEVDLLRAEVAAECVETLLENRDAATHRLSAEHGAAALAQLLEQSLAGPTLMNHFSEAYAGVTAPELIERWRAETDAHLRSRYDALAADPNISEWIRGLENLEGRCTDPADGREETRVSALASLREVASNRDAESMERALEALASLNFQKRGSKKNWVSKDAQDEVKRIAEQARDFGGDLALPPIDPHVEQSAAELTLDLLHIYRHAADAYREAKHARTALDFSDLLGRTLDMLDTRPDLRARVAGGIRHLLIDEFQDTNHAQLRMAQALSRSAEVGGAELFVVGDAKQSIYRFRGAEVGVFAQARALVDETLFLDENYRSVPEVISFINSFFDRSGVLRDVEPEFHRLLATRDAADEPCIEFLVPAEQTRDNGKEVGVDVYREAEARMIAARIAQLCGSDGIDICDPTTRQWRPAQFGDVALLFRKGTSVDTYDAALRDAGIPSVVLDGSGFYARQEILDMHNLFAAALDPWNEFALAAFLRGPLGGLSDDTLMELTRDRGLADAFMNKTKPTDAEEARRLDAARDLLLQVWSRREMPLPDLVREVLAWTGFEAILLPQIHGVQKAGNLRKLVDLAETFAQTGRASLNAFASYLWTVTQRELREGDAELVADAAGAVRLMTVHKAKGLEFPITVIADAGAHARGATGATLCHAHRDLGLAAVLHDARGTIVKPRVAELARRLDIENDEAEESRVLYVAMTRARDRLIVSMPPKGRKGTWAAHLHRELDGYSPVDDTLYARDGQRVRIMHEIDVSQMTAPEAASHETVDVTELFAFARPLQLGTPARSMPISGALDLMRDRAKRGPRTPALRATDENESAAFGNAAHALMEQWDFHSEPPFDTILREYCPQLTGRDAFNDKLNQMIETLKSSKLWPMLLTCNDIRREVPFVWRENEVHIRGKIDALLDGECIVDYKTGNPETADHSHYETQVQLYAAAAAESGQPMKKGYVYYTRSGELVEVDVSENALRTATDRLRKALSEPAA